jgi:mannose-6-phosphate isomerase-like protein (cupin superfamily)
MEHVKLTDFVQFTNDAVQRQTLFETERLFCELLCLDRTQTYGPVRDEGSDGVFTVLAGEAVFMVDGKRKRLTQWGAVLVPAGGEVTVRNSSIDPLVVMLTAAPPPG